MFVYYSLFKKNKILVLDLFREMFFCARAPFGVFGCACIISFQENVGIELQMRIINYRGWFISDLKAERPHFISGN